MENFITFSYNHYQSPYNADPGFHKTYLDYLKNGKLEAVPPSTPSKLSASLQSGGGVSLSWSASSDNIGVCGYYLYRDGTKIAKRQEREGMASGTRILLLQVSLIKALTLAVIHIRFRLLILPIMFLAYQNLLKFLCRQKIRIQSKYHKGYKICRR